MHGIDQFTELIQRRSGYVEFRHGWIDGMKIRGGERTSVLAHHRISHGNRKRRKRLDDPEPHKVHNMWKLANHIAKRTELTREYGIYGIRRTS